MTIGIPFDFLHDALLFSRADVSETLLRIEQFIAKTLDVNELPRLIQDLLDAHAIPYLPASFVTAATHCIRQGLCTSTGRYLQ